MVSEANVKDMPTFLLQIKYKGGRGRGGPGGCGGGCIHRLARSRRKKLEMY